MNELTEALGVRSESSDGTAPVQGQNAIESRTPVANPRGSTAQAQRPAGLAGATAAATGVALAACGGGHEGLTGPNGVQYLNDLSGAGGEMPPAPDAASQPTHRQAARFLAQASFGPRSADEIDAVRTDGFERWLWRQFHAPTLQHTSYVDWQRQRNAGTSANDALSYEAIWQHWLAGEDPLRARMAFALSQILVVSNVAGDLRAYGMSSYMDLLNRHAFGNYRDLLKAVTLHPTMGYFLNLLRSEKEDAKAGVHPNENYAREFLQLFTIGLVKLEADGTPKTGAGGAPLATYDQTVVEGFARAFTGWSFAQSRSFESADENLDANWTRPMLAFADRHSSGPKTLLDGVTIPGAAPEVDLEAAIDNAFAHPNVGPFVGRQLIQRLVTSNPSRAYIARVSAAFADNGAGVRGDLRAVVRAILLDAEALNPAAAGASGDGKQREPLLRMAALLRATGARNALGINFIHALDSSEGALGQSPLMAPSVFNFFSPNYRPAGAIAAAGLAAPEFQITTETTVVGGLNFLTSLIRNGGHGWGDGQLRMDLAPLEALAADPAGLVDRLDLLLFQGQMSTSTRTRLLTLVQALPASAPTRRVKAALTLSVMSPDHVIQR